MLLGRVVRLVNLYAAHVARYLWSCVAALVTSVLCALVSYHGLLVVQLAGFCAWWVLLLQNVAAQALV
jgi:hypothetical protein